MEEDFHYVHVERPVQCHAVSLKRQRAGLAGCALGGGKQKPAFPVSLTTVSASGRMDGRVKELRCSPGPGPPCRRADPLLRKSLEKSGRETVGCPRNRTGPVRKGVFT